MTLAQFLTALRATNRRWLIAYGETIRDEECGHCPISAVTGHLDDYDGAVEAGMRLGLSREDANLVLLAADYADSKSPREAALRRELLEICGIGGRG